MPRQNRRIDGEYPRGDKDWDDSESRYGASRPKSDLEIRVTNVRSVESTSYKRSDSDQEDNDSMPSKRHRSNNASPSPFVEDKRQKRLEANRRSAALSRQRKKGLIEQLQLEVEELSKRNNSLTAEVDALRKELIRVHAENKNMALKLSNDPPQGIAMAGQCIPILPQVQPLYGSLQAPLAANPQGSHAALSALLQALTGRGQICNSISNIQVLQQPSSASATSNTLLFGQTDVTFPTAPQNVSTNAQMDDNSGRPSNSAMISNNPFAKFWNGGDNGSHQSQEQSGSNIGAPASAPSSGQQEPTDISSLLLAAILMLNKRGGGGNTYNAAG